MTLNRPHARNAVNREMAEAIAEQMDNLDGDPTLAVAVITGGPDVFSSGMDLKAFARGDLPRVAGRGFAGLVEAPPSKPLIAAVEGFALAGGFEIALACDLVVASEQAVFGLPEVTRGLAATAGGLLRLGERVPFNVAKELVLTGRRLSATDAYRFGLVNRLVGSGDALPAAVELARTIADNAPLAVQGSKQVLARSSRWALEDRFDRQRDLIGHLATSNDAAEGARAFVEKRAPRWSGS